jgi:hypothetical protein
MIKNPKKISILGFGGHGWEIFSDYLSNTQNLVKMSTLTCDYGGSGGVWYRLLEHNNFELNIKLHGQKRPVFPWGDFNKIIQHFLSLKYNKLVGNTLNFRSEQLETHKVNFDILSDHLILEKEVYDRFWSYFCTSFKYYQKYKNELDYKTNKSFCFGYVWQEFTFWELGKVSDMNDFYKLKKILPKNLFLDFTHNKRTTLKGKNLNNLELVGEHFIDKSNTPILVKTLEIADLDKQDISSFRHFLFNLSQSQKILIPTGSIANWLPLLKIPEVVEELRKKPVFWFLNLVKSPNEMALIEYIQHLVNLKINLNLVTSNKIPDFTDNEQNLKPSFNKEEVDLLSELDVKVYFSLETKEKWKYEPKSVTKFLEKYV